MRNAIYIPAYSDGLMSMFYSMNDKEIATKYQPDFKKQKSLRIYNKKYDAYFHNPYLLISAGTQYNKKNFREKLDIGDECKIFVDSGGYQLAMGTVNANKYTDEVALKWSEANGNIFPILDRPAFSKLYDYDFSLKSSVNSAKYYQENRSKSDAYVLNVLQGENKEDMENWYKKISPYKFEGWGFGGSKGNLALIGMAILTLLNNGEFDREKCKYLHIFGVSSNEVMVYLQFIQRMLNRQDIDIQLTYDSTYWNRTCVFGGYFIREQYIIGTGMESMNWPNTIDYAKLGKDFKLPCWCPICEDLDDGYSFFNTFKKNKKGEEKISFVKFNMMVGFHNLFLQMIYNKMTNRILKADMPEVYKEAFSPKIYKNLMLLETVFSKPRNGDNYQILQQVFNKRKHETETANAFDV
ncbi:MAG: hypothetical protein QGH83_06935 [Candidatus Pacebacteria bacterium]|jgi:hypothetical protein|nr:hypothetical protein [Candidatus Paceibacterota bacterium]